jgi:hypothetical protein
MSSDEESSFHGSDVRSIDDDYDGDPAGIDVIDGGAVGYTSGSADDEMDDETDDDEPPPQKKRNESRHPAGKKGSATCNNRRSHPRENSADPQAAATRRAQRVSHEINIILNLRADIKIDVLNMVILSLSKEERVALRALGAMQQEHYVAARDTVTFLNNNCFTALKESCKFIITSSTLYTVPYTPRLFN